MSRRLASTVTTWSLVVLFGGLTPAIVGAQSVGDPITLDVRVFANEVYVGFDSDFAQFILADMLGGVTLFASVAPAGPVIARVAFPGPLSATLEGVPGAVFRNVPSGTYYITAVFGIVATPTVPAAGWTRVEVATAPQCTAPPAAPYIQNESPAASTSLRLFFGNVGRCSTSFLLDAGSTPWAADVAQFETFSQLLVSDVVPPGTYYLRLRGRNARGVSPYSELIPLSVPDCRAQAPSITNLTAQVTGNTVTLAWTASTPAGLPVTFREAFLHHVPVSPVPAVPLPGSGSSVTATVPAGDYRISIAIGNACGKYYSSAVAFTIP